MKLRSSLRSILERSSRYLELRYSPAVLKAWFLLRKDVAKELGEQEELYRSVLESNHRRKLVFDIGGNEGFTAAVFSKLARKVVVVEPSRRNFRILKARFRDRQDIVMLNGAVSDRAGVAGFYENAFDHACSTLNPRWQTIQTRQEGNFRKYDVEIFTLDHLMNIYGVPDFIKIDVEGHEEEVLSGLTRPVEMLSFEAILPHFRQATENNVRYLDTLGKCSFNFAEDHRMHYREFVPAETLLAALAQKNNVTLEIFCRSAF